jgi:subfamily B ATP-binding cassette protein MsbA
LVDFVGGILTAVLSLAILFKISAALTTVSIFFVVLAGVGLGNAFKSIRPIFRERGKINAEVTGRLTESLAGVRVVKGYHAEATEARVFAGGVQRLLDNVLKSLTAISLMSLSATVLMGVVGGTVMYIGARQILATPPTLTPGGLFSFTAYLAFLVAPMFQLVGIGTQITEALAGLDRTQEVLREKPEDEDPKRTVSIGTVTGDVAFENVNFEYDPGKPVLHEVSFASEPGTVTALVGPSGSGKSTMISLVAAFHEPTTGRVLVDGTDLSTVRLDAYRSQLGVVLQDTFLFDGTIRENIAFARPAATDAQIQEACRIARVDEFAERFEKKYETIVGERGVKLSGGQRQRVSIARAILADPRILILDEATSSLDSESEAAIQEGLSYLMKGRTTFVIAHRLSTIRRADQILVVEDGRIVERGTHDSLYALEGRYWDLYTRQHGIDANLFLAPGEGDSIPESEKKGGPGRGVSAPSPASLFGGRTA